MINAIIDVFHNHYIGLSVSPCGPMPNDYQIILEMFKQYPCITHQRPFDCRFLAFRQRLSNRHTRESVNFPIILLSYKEPIEACLVRVAN